MTNLCKYKIHGKDAVLNYRRSANTPVFYDTLEDARAAAASMARKSGATLVIFSAVELIGPLEPSIVMRNIFPGGTIGPAHHLTEPTVAEFDNTYWDRD